LECEDAIAIHKRRTRTHEEGALGRRLESALEIRNAIFLEKCRYWTGKTETIFSIINIIVLV